MVRAMHSPRLDWPALLLRGAVTITALLALFSYLGILH